MGGSFLPSHTYCGQGLCSFLPDGPFVAPPESSVQDPREGRVLGWQLILSLVEALPSQPQEAGLPGQPWECWEGCFISKGSAASRAVSALL